MLTGLRTDDAYAAEIGRADVVVLIIGANDLGTGAGLLGQTTTATTFATTPRWRRWATG